MTALPPPARRSRLRLVRLPDPRPPVLTPEELAAVVDGRPAPYVQDSLALDFHPLPDEVFGHQLTARDDLPDPVATVTRLAQGFVEVMAGLRPPPQLVRWTSPQVYEALCRRSVVAARRPPVARRPALVRKVRVQEPADGVVEACAVVVHHDRVRALALRLTGIDGRWVVTDLLVG